MRRISMDREKLIEYLDEHYPILTEEDFYPPLDDRVLSFGIDDVPGGDSYDDYLVYFWKSYECELFE